QLERVTFLDVGTVGGLPDHDVLLLRIPGNRRRAGQGVGKEGLRLVGGDDGALREEEVRPRPQDDEIGRAAQVFRDDEVRDPRIVFEEHERILSAAAARDARVRDEQRMLGDGRVRRYRERVGQHERLSAGRVAPAARGGAVACQDPYAEKLQAGDPHAVTETPDDADLAAVLAVRFDRRQLLPVFHRAVEGAVRPEGQAGDGRVLVRELQPGGETAGLRIAGGQDGSRRAAVRRPQAPVRRGRESRDLHRLLALFQGLGRPARDYRSRRLVDREQLAALRAAVPAAGIQRAVTAE